MARFFPFIAIIFSALLFFLYIKPTYSGTVHDTKQSIAGYDNALAAADRFEQKEAQLTQARVQIPPESLARLSNFLPDGVDNVQLILDMNALAARSGVTLSDFKINGESGSGGSGGGSGGANAPGGNSTPATTAGAPGGGLSANTPIDSLYFSFKGTGSYASFRTFLAGMENSLRPIDVVNLAVTVSDTGVYTYDTTVRIYWLH
jgi:hypothetical protein